LQHAPAAARRRGDLHAFAGRDGHGFFEQQFVAAFEQGDRRVAMLAVLRSVEGERGERRTLK